MRIIYESKQWSQMDSFHPGGAALTKYFIPHMKAGIGTSGKLLDIACGSGSSVNLLTSQGYDTIGIEQSGELVRRGKEQYPEAVLIQADAENLPFDDNVFHGGLCECVLSELDSNKVYSELARVLKPKGLLFVSDIYVRSEAEYSRAWWDEELCMYGFQCIHWADHTDYLLNMLSEWVWKNEKQPVPVFNCRIKEKTMSQLGYFSGVYRRN